MNCPSLCLNMIVKNESKIITSLLDSVSDIIDCSCICDTGSTDNTIEIIEKYFENKNIHGKIIVEPFQNFSYNRTFALQSAIGLSDYLLLMDADMILENNFFSKELLNSGDAFYIFQGNEDFYYKNLRIIKNNNQYIYKGVTHEYISIDNEIDKNIINIPKNKLFIKDIGDGGSKSDKFKRDIKLLNEGIINEPNNTRYYFYLANSYFDIKSYQNAIEIYKQRILMNGWNQEVWYCYYRIGLSYKHLNNISNAIFYWLEGYEYLPERLEGIYEIINFYRINNKHQLAYNFYLIANNILNKNFDKTNYLFLHNDIYTYKILHEYTIIAAYVNIKNINKEIIYLLNNCNNNDVINNILQNMKYYKFILEKESSINLDDTIKKYVNNDKNDFYSSSSCLIKKNNKYLLNIRYVNYYIEKDGSYTNTDKNIISLQKFILFDNKFNKINEKFFDLMYEDKKYIGIEDIKIFNFENKIKFIGTGLHKNNNLGLIFGNYNVDQILLLGNELKSNFNNNYCEKNWTFVNFKNDLNIIYSWHPLKICNIIDNKINIVQEKNMPNIFKYVRGSSSGFNFKNEIWFVSHIVSHEIPREYYHIITVFDDNMNLKKYSSPFKFEGESIEFCLSIIVESKRILINYSTWDRTTRIAIYNKKYIESILIES